MNILFKQLFVTLLALFLIYGCAANTQNNGAESRDEMGENVDDLFGIPEEETSSSAPSDDEAEVFRLLGISKEESAEQTSTQAKPEEETEVLNTEINQLENRLDEKDTEIASLKSEIAIKDQKINELQTTLETTSQTERYSGTGSFKEEYNIALSEYNSRNYKSAISRFQSLLTRDYNNSLSDNCQYWIGESYYGLANYNQAIVEFTKVFSFNKSNKFDDSQLKLGLCYYRLGDKEKAREEFQRLVSDYPNSEYVGKAKQYLSQL